MFAEIKIDGVWQKVGKEFKSTYPELSDGTDRVYDGGISLLQWLTYNTEPNGMPEDASEEIQQLKYFNDKKVYYIQLDELLALDLWDMEIYEHIGYITEWQYKRFKEDNIEPANVRHEIYNPAAKRVTRFEMDMIMHNPKLRDSQVYYVEHHYDKIVMKQKFDFFCNTSIPRLIELIPEGGTAKDVRIIFGR